jgi:hypothetical protein
VPQCLANSRERAAPASVPAVFSCNQTSPFGHYVVHAHWLFTVTDTACDPSDLSYDRSVGSPIPKTGNGPSCGNTEPPYGSVAEGSVRKTVHELALKALSLILIVVCSQSAAEERALLRSDVVFFMDDPKQYERLRGVRWWAGAPTPDTDHFRGPTTRDGECAFWPHSVFCSGPSVRVIVFSATSF